MLLSTHLGMHWEGCVNGDSHLIFGRRASLRRRSRSCNFCEACSTEDNENNAPPKAQSNLKLTATGSDEPPFLTVGTEVSAKYKGAFCEAKIRKVVRCVKCKVVFKEPGYGSTILTDDHLKGQIRLGGAVLVRHPDKRDGAEATIVKVQDSSQYTVVFDDGDITTLRRTALCLKSGRHFAESETLDQLPLTHPEHFSNPVIGGRRGRRNRNGVGDNSGDEEAFRFLKDYTDEKEEDIGRVICVEGTEKKKQKDNWFPGLVVAPTAQDTVPIDVRLEYLIRSFKDGRYYTVPKKEALEFTREMGARAESGSGVLKAAVEKALQFLDKDELPAHWDRDLLFGLNEMPGTDSDAGMEYDSSDDEPREEKDHFVAQLYKFMDDSGTPINKGPIICGQDVDLYKLFKVVQNLGGFNRVTNQNNWKIVSNKMGFGQNPGTVNVVKQSYKKFLYSFEDFYRKLGCTMVNHPRTSRTRNRSGRSLIRAIKQQEPVIKQEPGIMQEPVIKQEPGIMQELRIKQEPGIETYQDENVAGPSHYFPFIFPEDIKVEVIDPGYQMEPVPSTSGVRQTGRKAQENVILEEVKIKQEPLDVDDVKVVATKETKKTRQKKPRTVPTETASKKEPPKESSSAPKEKKKRLFTRSKKEKEKEKPKINAVKKTNPPLTTRQKRTVKEKIKVFADNIKAKTSKLANVALVLQDQCEKVTQNIKGKVKERNIVNKIKKEDPVLPPTSLEERKKGQNRRRDNTQMMNLKGLPICTKPIYVGDKLKVYYGPHDGRQDYRVTYEARVLSIRKDGSQSRYLVHYYGWNNRYDEWIKISRIADNLSTGRTTRKSQQAPRASRTRSSQLKIDPDIIEIPEDQPNEILQQKQETTPSFSPPARTRGTRTRSSSRRMASMSENDEYESDNVHPESVGFKSGFELQKSNNPIMPAKRSQKRKSTDNKDKAQDKGKIVTSAKQSRLLSPNSDVRGISSPQPQDYVPDEGTVTVKIEPISELEETSRNYQDFDESSNEQFSYVQEDEAMFKKEVLSEDEEKYSPQGRDFDLNEIRSELKGIETAVGSVTKTEEIKEGGQRGENFYVVDMEEQEETWIDEEDNEQDESNTDSVPPTVCNIEMKQNADIEDVYEFKEPEPFEFESRKIDDNNILQRRTLNRYIEEHKYSPQRKRTKLSASPTYSTTSANFSDNVTAAITKELGSTGQEYPRFETCEEAFDKICASPLRAANEATPFFEEQIVNDQVEDNLDNDSEQRLLLSQISKRYISESKSDGLIQSDKTEETKSVIIEIKTRKEKEKGVLQEEKEDSRDSNKEEWKDEVEDEELSVAIQRVINQESSDDTNDCEVANKTSCQKSTKNTNVESKHESKHTKNKCKIEKREEIYFEEGSPNCKYNKKCYEYDQPPVQEENEYNNIRDIETEVVASYEDSSEPPNKDEVNIDSEMKEGSFENFKSENEEVEEEQGSEELEEQGEEELEEEQGAEELEDEQGAEELEEDQGDEELEEEQGAEEIEEVKVAAELVEERGVDVLEEQGLDELEEERGVDELEEEQGAAELEEEQGLVDLEEENGVDDLEEDEGVDELEEEQEVDELDEEHGVDELEEELAADELEEEQVAAELDEQVSTELDKEQREAELEEQGVIEDSAEEPCVENVEVDKNRTLTLAEIITSDSHGYVEEVEGESIVTTIVTMDDMQDIEDLQVSTLAHAAKSIDTKELENPNDDNEETDDDDDLEVVNPDDLEVVNPDDLEVLNPNDLEVINSNVLEVVTPNALEVVNPNVLEVVNPNILEVVNPNRLEVVNPNRLEVLNPNRLEVLNPNDLEIELRQETTIVLNQVLHSVKFDKAFQKRGLYCRYDNSSFMEAGTSKVSGRDSNLEVDGEEDDEEEQVNIEVREEIVKTEQNVGTREKLEGVGLNIKFVESNEDDYEDEEEDDEDNRMEAVHKEVVIKEADIDREVFIESDMVDMKDEEEDDEDEKAEKDLEDEEEDEKDDEEDEKNTDEEDEKDVDKEEEEQLMSLLCDEEIIPGSPCPDLQGDQENSEAIDDMDNDEEEIPLSEKLKECERIVGKTLLAQENSPPASPDSSGSSMSSPLQERMMSPSTEAMNAKHNSISDYEIEATSQKVEDIRGHRLETRLRKAEGKASAKKGRRPCKRTQETGKRKYVRSSRQQGSDSDDLFESPRPSTSREPPLPQRPTRSGKYNFAVKLDPEFDSNKRIAVIQLAIQHLRRSYLDVKAELAVIDRRRKKLRRRERENAAARFH